MLFKMDLQMFRLSAVQLQDYKNSTVLFYSLPIFFYHIFAPIPPCFKQTNWISVLKISKLSQASAICWYARHCLWTVSYILSR